jgi:hypothetical protein
MKLLTGGILWLQTILSMDKILKDSVVIDIAPQWEVLGPFQIGTRGTICLLAETIMIEALSM